MLLSKRHFLVGLASLTAACGFSPVYQDGGLARGMFSFDLPETEQGFLMLRALEDRLGAPSNPRWTLLVSPTQGEEESINNDPQNTYKSRLFGAANWTIKDGSATVAQGRVQGFVNFTQKGAIYAERAAREDAQERLAAILADRVTRAIQGAL